MLSALLTGLALLAAAPDATAPGADRQPPVAGSVTAFVGVTVVPADRERVLPDHTVLIRGGRIAAVGLATRVKVPAGAVRIDGTGKFLMPGIAEMHGHLPLQDHTGELSALWLKLFIANGVTTVRGMQGAALQFKVRDQVKRGELLGPRLVLFATPMAGTNVPTPERGAELVREYQRAGYDGLKISEGLTVATFEAIARTARQLKMPFGGHVPNAVGLLRALAAGQRNVEHLDGYVEALVRDGGAVGDRPDSEVVRGGIMGADWPALDRVDESAIPGLVAATKRARAMVTPTMAVWRTLFGDADGAALARLPELQYIPARMRDQWARDQAARAKEAVPVERLRKLMAVRDRLLKALADAGGLIMLGADAPQRYSVPGFSLRHETAALIKAGMTPWQVVQAATVAPAHYLGLEKEFGTVAVGKRADLILVEGNPLEDVANIFRSTGVMVSGRWLPRAELDAMLADVARELHFPADAEIKDLPITAAAAAAVTGSYKFVGGDQTIVVSSTDGGLFATAGGNKDKKPRLRWQGGGTYLVPEDKMKVIFDIKEGRATSMTAHGDGARLKFILVGR